MDLTSLSSNLPRNGPPESCSDDHEPDEPSSAILMSSFKSAALSVTTLYKSAAEQADRSRRTGRIEGYNDCIDDVLNLLSRIEPRTDPKTTEVVKQWALSRRRKAGPRPPAPPREDRETSLESDSGANARPTAPQSQPHPQSHLHPQPQPPLQSQVHQTNQSNPASISSPMNLSPVRTTVPSQMPIFTFRSEHHMPQTVDFDLPYNDDLNSPPPSPTIDIGQNIFQSAAVNKSASNIGTPRGSQHPRSHQPRTGSKRRYGNMSDFFDLAGLEKYNKKGRFQ